MVGGKCSPTTYNYHLPPRTILGQTFRNASRNKCGSVRTQRGLRDETLSVHRDTCVSVLPPALLFSGRSRCQCQS